MSRDEHLKLLRGIELNAASRRAQMAGLDPVVPGAASPPPFKPQQDCISIAKSKSTSSAAGRPHIGPQLSPDLVSNDPLGLTQPA